jgi:hypothetical protein
MNLEKIFFLGIAFGSLAFGANGSAEQHEPFHPYLGHIPINDQEERHRSYKQQMREHKMSEEQKLVIGKREREEPLTDRDSRYRKENHDGPSGLMPPPLELPPSGLETSNVSRLLNFNCVEELEQRFTKLSVSEPSHDYSVTRKESLPFGN